MPELLCAGILANFEATCSLLAETIAQFDVDSWTQPGVDSFQVPVMIANHAVECLDYFFRADTSAPWDWGWPFRGKWELAEQKLPSPDQVLGYLMETRERIRVHMAALTDADLAAPYAFTATRLEHYLYALRHTMHHHGALSLLALQMGKPVGHWE